MNCKCGHSEHTHTGIIKDESSGPCVVQGCTCREYEKE